MPIFWRMFSRVATLLAILAITAVTSLTLAHAARLSAQPDHAVHVAETKGMHSAAASCDRDQQCGSVDTAMCEFVCTGLSVFLPSPGGDAGHCYLRVSHDRKSEESHASIVPGLNERPPKNRLL